MNDNINKTLLNAYEVQGILQIPLSTLYYLTKAGAIKSLRIGKHIKYKREDIQNYLENGIGEPKKTVIYRDTPQTERRTYPRINCALDCNLLINIPQTKNINFNGTIQNISSSGILLYITKNTDDIFKIKRDDPVKMGFNLDMQDKKEDIEEISILGRVVRKEDNGIAVRFRAIPEETREKLINYVGE